MIGITFDELAEFPVRLARTYWAISQTHRNWTPASWEGIPSEQFSALGQAKGLLHLLCSHDQQHLAGLQWLLARIEAPSQQNR